MTLAIDQTLAARSSYYYVSIGALSAPELEWGWDLTEWLCVELDNRLFVGFGNGYIANALAGRYTVVGVDISTVALRHLKVPGCLASVAQLPCANEAFDLVIASEIIEHLPPGELDVALRKSNGLQGATSSRQFPLPRI